ncbi:MAG: hypothetical protein HWD60_02755 [Defluviicoccus sp.]|nr:MAG: hypothetical protein HWD60_02755 [Defluviicoccus sp.]
MDVAVTITTLRGKTDELQATAFTTQSYSIKKVRRVINQDKKNSEVEPSYKLTHSRALRQKGYRQARSFHRQKKSATIVVAVTETGDGGKMFGKFKKFLDANAKAIRDAGLEVVNTWLPD